MFKPHQHRFANCGGGFTLIEMLVAVTLLAAAMVISFTTFYSVSRAWQQGVLMADNLDRGAFAMEQLAGGLRSAFFPPAQAASSAAETSSAASTNAAQTNDADTTPAVTPAPGGGYGFALEDNGSESDARDTISWVKTGTTLLPLDSPLSKGLHRVRVSVEEDEDGESSLAVRAWRPYGNPIDFDPLALPPHFVAGKVVGLECRVAHEIKDKEWNWLNVWENEATNCLPLVVELTLYLEPVEKEGAPVELRRTVQIPVAPLSWSNVQHSAP